jgi:hypothetical protein
MAGFAKMFSMTLYSLYSLMSHFAAFATVSLVIFRSSEQHLLL